MATAYDHRSTCHTPFAPPLRLSSPSRLSAAAPAPSTVLSSPNLPERGEKTKVWVPPPSPSPESFSTSPSAAPIRTSHQPTTPPPPPPKSSPISQRAPCIAPSLLSYIATVSQQAPSSSHP
ncbi:hypothetical protein CGRA01v4_03671 [Colletotrichum graminicola]|nr:hypothetical protein CGRA01v4_03671 [Colletotrichum graminicola]